MPRHFTDEQLDDELRRLVAAVTAESPPAPGLDDLLGEDRADLPRLVRRAGLSSRRWPVALAAAVVAVLGIAGGLVIAGIDEPDEVHTGSEPFVDDETAPQRLILEGIQEGDAKGEVLPDGTVAAPLPLGGLDPLGLSGDVFALGDGQTVMLGVPAPPPATEDGVTHHLVVLGADGSVLVDRPVDQGGDVGLLAVTSTEAIFGRTDADGGLRVVAHDYATARERTLDEPSAQSFLLDVAGNRLVSVVGGLDGSSGSPCRVRTLDVVTGERRSYELPSRCEQVRAVRASPDGSSVAVAYQYLNVDEADVDEVRVAVIDLTSGEVPLDEFLGDILTSCSGPGCPEVLADYLGMAWDDDSRLRVALLDLTKTPPGEEASGDAATLPPDALLIRSFDVAG